MTSRKDASRETAETSFRSAFALRLKQAAQSYEIKDLAAKVGATPATVYRWLNGQFDPSLPKLSELAEAMNVNLAWLVTASGFQGRLVVKPIRKGTSFLLLRLVLRVDLGADLERDTQSAGRGGIVR
jgi:transcriptional regulator with XRE-family HTH domain